MSITGAETLLAVKLLHLVPGLRPSERQVGAALLEHYNRRSGRCDPSVERIAALLGLSERTVMRATEVLERRGLLRKVRHGGYSNRNRYEPSWATFRELAAAWDEKFAQAARSRGTALSPTTGQAGHVPGDAAVTQTCRSNLQKLTSRKELPKKEELERPLPVASARVTGTAVRSAEAARAAAERRWSNDLHRRYAATPTIYGTVVEAITPEMREGATDAELHQRGGGLVYLTAELPPESQP